ncbi:unnamed protein product, partial [Prorocentrum cordatum]
GQVQEVSSAAWAPGALRLHTSCMAASRADPGDAFAAKRLLLGGTSAWYVPAHFEPVKKVSMCAHTEVLTFLDTESGSIVSVKKVKDAMRNLADAQRLLREVKVLRSARHENLLAVVDAYAPSSLKDVYVVTPAMQSSLHRVISSGQTLTWEHRRLLLHQILKGLLYLHSAGLVHRELRPSNILVNANCSLKICNFGLTRCREEEDGVAASEYRAPELLLGSRYTCAVDIWAAGCILGELAAGRAVFGGRDSLDQLRRILSVLGPPPAGDLDWIPSSGRELLQELLRTALRGGRPACWADVIPGSPGLELQTVESMLAFGPRRRPTALDMLRHPSLQPYHSEADEVRSESTFDLSFDRHALSDEELRGRLRDECRIFQHSQASPSTRLFTPEHRGARLGVVALPSCHSERGSAWSYSPLSSAGGEGLSPPFRAAGGSGQVAEAECTLASEASSSLVAAALEVGADAGGSQAFRAGFGPSHLTLRRSGID